MKLETASCGRNWVGTPLTVWRTSDRKYFLEFFRFDGLITHDAEAGFVYIRANSMARTAGGGGKSITIHTYFLLKGRETILSYILHHSQNPLGELRVPVPNA